MNSIQTNERHMNIKQHFEVENIPVSMREYDQWVCWKYHSDGVPGQDRRRKVPVNPRTGRFAKVTGETTWTSLDKALEFASQPNQHMDGIGFVFTENDPFVGVDLDDCRNELTGRLDPWAQEVVSKLGSYSEVSPSRTGVKVFHKTDSLFPSRRRSKPGLEVYRSARFFTVTGQILGMHSETNDGTDAIQWIQDRYFPDVVPESSDQWTESKLMMASDEQVVTKATTRLGTVQSSDNFGKEVSNSTTETKAKLISVSVDYWPSGVDHATSRLIACFVRADCFGRSGMRGTSVQGQPTGWKQSGNLSSLRGTFSTGGLPNAMKTNPFL